MDKKKRNNTRKKRITLLKVLTVMALFVGTIVFALVSPVFNIEVITVKGNEKVDSETIISLSGIKTGTNIFRSVGSEVKKNIKENPYVANVKVERKLPNEIEISIEERKLEYQIKVIDGYVGIDYQGYILEKFLTSQKVPTLEGMETDQNGLINETRVWKKDIEHLNTILKLMESAKNLNIYKLISKIIIKDGEYILYLPKAKKYAYLGNGTESTNRMLYVKTILEKEEKNSGRIFVNGSLNDGFKPYFREEKID